ncbi:NAD(P)H-quinone oxidoreductase subunit 5, chloroplastic-like [Primulina tabacum]|uniref:NAD(P)H-quinone oxidoreductase subunit 5, chloroplastic-like n=1 Tax=Primulina tabacum TaxID=48773 RepID=UPI003F5932A9
MGLNGALLQIISHGFIGAALFFLAGTTYDRIRLVYLDEMGGIAIPMPKIFTMFSSFSMAYLALPGFWFTRPLAANACQKAFVTNRVGDFGLLLGILGFYWITVAKSAQFPLHVWLPDAMEGPTPISALIHAATMVAAGIITVFLGASLALAQKDIKRGLAYSTMSQLGYMMVALGMGSYRSALFHLITHAYSKALLFLGSGSVIHSMETIVGYSPDKSHNMEFLLIKNEQI